MQPGDIIADRFEIRRLIGGGAMGVVFLAHDHATHADVAMKVLREGQGDATRFLREAQVLADVHHPHVVRYVAHGATSLEEAYLVMEWIEGEDLGRRLSRGRLRVDACVALGARVASALAEAHARGVIHRDVKPSNLFLPGGDVGRIKVLDFGIARLSGVARATQTGAVLGTPGYMPPEQARGEDVLDPRADIFSLGCVLFECLTGAPAFAGQHLPAVLAKILFEPAPRARALSPEVPEALDDLVHRMLGKDVAGRPSAAEAAAALAALDRLAGTELGAPSSSGAPSLTSDEQRVLSVVMIGAAPGAPALDVEHLRRVAAGRGAILERLADGSIAATLREALPPLDEAAQAARLAHDLHAVVPTRPIVMATCRSGGLFKRTVGDAINRAVGLLEELATAGGPAGAPRLPLVDDISARLLEKRFQLVRAPPGFAIVAELDAALSVPTLLGQVSPYVGRKAELGVLTTLFTECVEDSIAHAALVTAPSGFGKSRIAQELLRVARRDAPAATIWTARGDALRAGAVFGLLADALRNAAGLRRGDPPALSRARLEAYVAERVPAPDRVRVTEFLGELAAVPFPDDDSPALFAARTDARLMREQLVRAWADLLRAECAARPVVLVLDDLQWGDAPSIRCVGRALATLKTAPFFVLGLARPEVTQVFPRLWEDEGVVNLRLKELTRRAGTEMVERALGAQATPGLVERLVTQAGGHALYLEELVRAAAEGREETSPETVLVLVGARLALLAPEARRVLRAASVFGDVCWSGGVAALVSDAGPDAVQRHLDALCTQEVLVRRGDGRFTGQVEYAFRHALLREGAYAQLTDADRALGHRLAGAWLSAHGDPDALVLAEHWSRAGDAERAGRAYARAAEQAYRAGDAAAAVRHARRGLAFTLPTEVRAALLGVLCEAYMWRSEWDSAASLVEEALALARPGSVPWVHAATAELWLRVAQGSFDAVPAVVERIHRTPIDADAADHAALALGVGVFALDMLGRFDLAGTTLVHLGSMVDPIAPRGGGARGWLSFARAHFATFAEDDPFRALGHARVALASFQDADDQRGIPVAQLAAGLCLWLLGALEEAERTLRGAVVDWDLGDFALLRDYYLARVLADRGLLDPAAEMAHALLARAERVKNPRFEGRGHGLLARIARCAGDLDAAERAVLLALERTPDRVLYRVIVLLERASLRLAQGQGDEALRCAAEARALCDARRHARVRARLVHAEALFATGHRARARVALAEARALLHDEADRIGAPALQRSFIERVPEHARVLQLAVATDHEGVKDR
jgi:tetratricopeptide (TPR) repeat protein